jgi:hypothetical protein
MARAANASVRRGLPERAVKASKAPKTSKTASPRKRSWPLALLAVACSAVVLAFTPVTTRQGVNFVVTSHSLPLYAKALDFLDRDSNYRRLTAQVMSGATTDEAKVRAAAEWTTANIRETPPGFPVVDDHTWNIIVRGYGQDDQQASVFTTLLAYAGVRAYWIFIGPRPELTLSLALVDGAWRAIDVSNHVIFRAAGGRLATAGDLAADHALAARQGPANFHGLPYARFFDRFAAPDPPDLTHPEMQMAGPRLWFEARYLIGRGGRMWEMRPPSRLAGPSNEDSSR